MLELARLFRDAKPARTLRFVAFVNEEPPFYRERRRWAAAATRGARRSAGENIVAMFSLETIGYYSERPGSQHYPFPLGFFYPSTGNFIAFVSNLSSRALLHEATRELPPSRRVSVRGVAAPAFIPGRGLVRPLVVLEGGLFRR